MADFNAGEPVTYYGPSQCFLAEFVREEPTAPGVALVTVTDPLLSWRRKGEAVHVGTANLTHPAPAHLFEV